MTLTTPILTEDNFMFPKSKRHTVKKYKNTQAFQICISAHSRTHIHPQGKQFALLDDMDNIYAPTSPTQLCVMAVGFCHNGIEMHGDFSYK